jgi:hypothetical protein
MAPDLLRGLRCATCPTAPNPASLVVGLRATTHNAVPCESWASNIKKRLTGLPVQLGSHVPNTRAHIFNASDVRVIMDL